MDNRYDNCKYFNSLIVNILDIIKKQMRCYKYKYLYSLLAGTGVNLREMDVRKKTQFVGVTV